MTEADEQLWRITCPCGWRSHGTKDDLVRDVKLHMRVDHDEEITDQDAVDSLEPAEAAG